MKNQDMPANPCSFIEEHLSSDGEKVLLKTDCNGETKFEKAFWQVYSSMLSNVNLNYEYIANDALKAVHAGFKALENNNE